MLDMVGGWNGLAGDSVAVPDYARDCISDSLAATPRGGPLPTECEALTLSRSRDVFALFQDAAVRGVRCPTNDAIGNTLGIANPDKFIREVKARGLISAIYFHGALFRQVTILVGPNAGKATAPLEACPDFCAQWHKPHLHTVTTKRKLRQVLARDLKSRTKPTCAWCGGKLRGGYETRSCCSTDCTRLWTRHGFASKKQVEQRRHRPPGPKGCTSVEQWLAAGGTIYRENSRCEVVRAA